MENFKLQINQTNVLARFANESDWQKHFTQQELDNFTSEQIEGRIGWHDEPIIGYVSAYHKLSNDLNYFEIYPVLASEMATGSIDIINSLETRDGFLRIIIPEPNFLKQSNIHNENL